MNNYFETSQHFGLRKLSVGLASVLIGISFGIAMNNDVACADVINDEPVAQAAVRQDDASQTKSVQNNAQIALAITKQLPVQKSKPTNVNRAQADSADDLRATDIKSVQTGLPKAIQTVKTSRVDSSDKDVSNSNQDTDTAQTRHVIVDFVAANDNKTVRAGSKLQDSAAVDVYYTRSKTVNSDGTVKYGVWQWDTTKGDHGYKILSGKWGHIDNDTNKYVDGLPQSWANVAVFVPEIKGYTAITSGDWSTDPDGHVIDASQFVFPTYAGHSTTIAGEESLAYTSESPLYEVQNHHVIYYVPIQYDTRTVTEHYKYFDGKNYTDALLVDNGSSKQSYAQCQVFYSRTGKSVKTNKSLDPTKWQIGYNGWTWDKALGDVATPGYRVLSGGYTDKNGVKHGQGLWRGIDRSGSWGINIPDVSDYTTVRLREDTANTTDTFGSPIGKSDAFIDNSNRDWYWNKDLTSFYVKNDLLAKTVTRMIKINDSIEKTSRTVTQTVRFMRQARVNQGTSGDSGDAYIVFGAYIDHNPYNFVRGDNLWDHAKNEDNARGTFDSYDVTSENRIAHIGDQEITAVPSLTIDPTADSSTVDVVYSHKMQTQTIQSPSDRTFDIYLPNGTCTVYKQTLAYNYNEILDLYNHKVTRGALNFDKDKSSFTIDGVVQNKAAYVIKNGEVYFASFDLPTVPGYEAVIKRDAPRIYLISFVQSAAPKRDLNSKAGKQGEQMESALVHRHKTDQVNEDAPNILSNNSVKTEPAIKYMTDNSYKESNIHNAREDAMEKRDYAEPAQDSVLKKAVKRAMRRVKVTQYNYAKKTRKPAREADKTIKRGSIKAEHVAELGNKMRENAIIEKHDVKPNKAVLTQSNMHTVKRAVKSNSDNMRLPETGTRENIWLSVIGLAMLIGIGGIEIRNRRK